MMQVSILTNIYLFEKVVVQWPRYEIYIFNIRRENHLKSHLVSVNLMSGYDPEMDKHPIQAKVEMGKLYWKLTETFINSTSMGHLTQPEL